MVIPYVRLYMIYILDIYVARESYHQSSQHSHFFWKKNDFLFIKMHVVNRRLMNGSTTMAFINRSYTPHYLVYRYRICFGISKTFILLGKNIVTDINLLKYNTILYQLVRAIYIEDAEIARNLIISLESFREYVDRKIDYALSNSCHLGDKSCVPGWYSIEHVGEGIIAKIEGIEFPIITEKSDEKSEKHICSKLWGTFLKHMAEPYPPAVKSARNFTL